jgi:hypothetical protein
MRQMDLAATSLWPDKAPSFKPLRKEPGSVLRGPQNFYQVAAPPPENEDVAIHGILLKRDLHLRRQTLESTAHVGDARCDLDAGARRQPDHRDSSRISSRSISGGTSARIRKRARSNSILQMFVTGSGALTVVGATGRSASATRFTGNHGSALLTGFDGAPSDSAGDPYAPQGNVVAT